MEHHTWELSLTVITEDMRGAVRKSCFHCAIAKAFRRYFVLPDHDKSVFVNNYALVLDESRNFPHCTGRKEQIWLGDVASQNLITAIDSSMPVAFPVTVAYSFLR